MYKIGIATDSHSGISKKEAELHGIHVLPMPFFMDEESLYDDSNLDREAFYERMKAGAKVSTTQPSPADVMHFWDELLAIYDKVVYIPISSGLSGSCTTACAMAQDAPYEGRVFVVDNGRVSVPQYRTVLDALELVKEGYDAEQIRTILEASRDKAIIYVGVESLEYLKRGGRLSATSVTVGTLLNIKPVLKFSVGQLDVHRKCRGFAKARKEMIEAMRNEFQTTFREEYERGEVYLMAASSADPRTTADWLSQIREAFPGMEVLCDDLALAVTCHIGPGGLGIACSCRPSRDVASSPENTR